MQDWIASLGPFPLLLVEVYGALRSEASELVLYEVAALSRKLLTALVRMTLSSNYLVACSSCTSWRSLVAATEPLQPTSSLSFLCSM